MKTVKVIKTIMDNPVFDKDKTLQMQRKIMSKSVIDQKYGSGAADFFANAIDLFYKNE